MQIKSQFKVSNKSLRLLGVGTLKSPKLCTFMCDEEDGGIIDYEDYNIMLSTIMMSPKIFFRVFMEKDEEWFESQNADWQDEQKIVNLIQMSDEAIQAFTDSLNFFFKEEVKFSEQYKMFLTYNGEKDDDGELIPNGMLHPEIFEEVLDVIKQLNGINVKEEVKPKFKNDRQREMWKKMQEGKKLREQSKGLDGRLELCNIISAVANRHPSLNFLNIYDLTVTQLYTCFRRLQNNTMFDIQSTSVAAYGDSEGKFDDGGWYTTLDNQKNRADEKS
jgi:hypothetical protein